jgi:hypothetical protein
MKISRRRNVVPTICGSILRLFHADFITASAASDRNSGYANGGVIADDQLQDRGRLRRLATQLYETASQPAAPDINRLH